MNELKEKFEIKCKKCGSKDIEYIYLVRITGEDYVLIYCDDCNSEVEL